MVRGILSSVAATSNSIAGMYLSGVSTGVAVTLSSTASIFVDQAQNSTITGTASGLNTVQYSTGSCQVTSPFSVGALFLPVCTQVAFLSVPEPTPTWTCGLSVEGNFTCRPGTYSRSSIIKLYYLESNIRGFR